MTTSKYNKLKLEVKQTIRLLQMKTTLIISAVVVGIVLAVVIQTGFQKKSLGDDWPGEMTISGTVEGNPGEMVFLVIDRNENGKYDLEDEVIQKTETSKSGHYTFYYRPPIHESWTEVWELKSTYDDVELQPNGDVQAFSDDLDLNEEVVGLCFHRVGSNRNGVVKGASLQLTPAEMEMGYCALDIRSGLIKTNSELNATTEKIEIGEWQEGVADTIILNSILNGAEINGLDSLWIWIHPGDGLDDRDALAFKENKSSPSSLTLNLSIPENLKLLVVTESKKMNPPIYHVSGSKMEYNFFLREDLWTLINCNGKRVDDAIELVWTTGSRPSDNAMIKLTAGKTEVLYEGTMHELEQSMGSYRLNMPDPKPFQEIILLNLELWDSSTVIHQNMELRKNRARVSHVKVGPNPLQDQVQLSCVTLCPLPVRVFDLTGNMVAEFHSGVGYNKMTFDTNSWRKGTYILKIGDSDYQTKLVKI